MKGSKHTSLLLQRLGLLTQVFKDYRQTENFTIEPTPIKRTQVGCDFTTTQCGWKPSPFTTVYTVIEWLTDPSWAVAPGLRTPDRTKAMSPRSQTHTADTASH